MLRTTLITGLRVSRPSASLVSTRNYAGPAKSGGKVNDPIQQLFLDKIREYRQKSSGGKMVEASPEVEAELKGEMEKLEKQYGGGAGIDLTQFPTFNFPEPKIDPIDEPTEKDKGSSKK